MLGPIFAREALTLPRRGSHYVGRAAYLGLLWVLALTAWQTTVGWGQTVTLYETGRFGPLLFRLMAVVQLVLIIFFAALSAAGAVAQEKDRRTFILLLVSDLKNHEIVLGKLVGSLLQIALLLAAVAPLLLLTTFLGGVAPYQVAQTLLIFAATAVAAGSLGCLMALWREKTFQAVALTFLLVVLYFCVVNGLPLALFSDADPETLQKVEYYQQWFDPFRAVASVQQPPEPDALPLSPAVGYALVMAGFSALLVGLGMWKLRVWNPSGEPIMQRERPEDVEAKAKALGRDIHAAPGPVREVGDNPILWREVYTRAYGRRPLLVKVAYLLVVGLICYYALAPLFGGAGKDDDFKAAWGLVPVCILSILLVAAQAATAITSERDTGALDLLLVTDLTPQEFIYGKLGGILYNAKEYLLPPLILTVVYAVMKMLAKPPEGHSELTAAMNFEAAACIVGGALVMMAFTMVLGIHVSLRTPNSRLAILNTLSTVFFLSVGTLVCVYLILINRQFEAQWTSFLIFAAAGVGGLMWVLNGTRPSAALVLASWFCPFAVLYAVVNVLVGKPGTPESADPLLPFLVIGGAFGFAVSAMLIPLISEFDVALGRTTGGGE